MPSRSQRKVWRSLLRRKGRERHGLFLAEGPRVVADLLRSGLRTEAVLVASAADSDPELAGLARAAAEAGVPVEEVEAAELETLADTVTPQGVLAVGRIPEGPWPADEVTRILVLDAVQDPGNVGTLIRTAEAVGVDLVVCLPGTADPWSPKVVRAAAGSSFRLPVVSLEWTEARARIRAAEAAIWAADAAGSPLFRGDLAPARLALVVGNEARGVSPSVLAEADRRVAIPMVGRVESLNVAVAGAILMDRALGRSGIEGGAGGGGG